jgi:hypothetical protein
MAIVMQAAGDPAASTPNTIAFGSFAAIAIALAWALCRPLFTGRMAVKAPSNEQE